MTAPRLSDDGDAAISRAEVCVVACADAWRGDGATIASTTSLIPLLGARLAKLTFEPDLLLSHHEGRLTTDTPAALWEEDREPVTEGWLPYRALLDAAAAGHRHLMADAARLDRHGNHDHPQVGDIAGGTLNHPVTYWVARHSRQVFTDHLTRVCGVGHDRARNAAERNTRHHEVRAVITDLAVLDWRTRNGSARLRSVHPGVTADDVLAATGFPLVVPRRVATTRTPDAEELRLIRKVLDPAGLRELELAYPPAHTGLRPAGPTAALSA